MFFTLNPSFYPSTSSTTSPCRFFNPRRWVSKALDPVGESFLGISSIQGRETKQAPAWLPIGSSTRVYSINFRETSIRKAAYEYQYREWPNRTWYTNNSIQRMVRSYCSARKRGPPCRLPLAPCETTQQAVVAFLLASSGLGSIVVRVEGIYL